MAADPGERRKQPFHITRADGELFAFAGLWSVWHRGEPEELRSCTIITTAANPRVAPNHDRMPVILRRDAEALWLARDTPLTACGSSCTGLRPSRCAQGPLDPPSTTPGTTGPSACSIRPRRRRRPYSLRNPYGRRR